MGGLSDIGDRQPQLRTYHQNKTWFERITYKKNEHRILYRKKTLVFIIICILSFVGQHYFYEI